MTLEQVKKYISSIGGEIPDELLQAWIEIIDDYKECLESNYKPAVIVVIYYYLIALMSVSFSVKYVSSQSLPGGLSRSFRYTDPSSVWKSQLSLLRSMDTKGCVDAIIPSDPFYSANGLLLTVRAKGCMR